jgi:hypothetical protein
MFLPRGCHWENRQLHSTLEKSHLKSFSDFGKKTQHKKTKPALTNSFSLGPKGIWEVFDGLCF